MPEVAELLRVNEKTVRVAIKSGLLQASRPGRNLLITESSLQSYLEKTRVQPSDVATEDLESGGGE